MECWIEEVGQFILLLTKLISSGNILTYTAVETALDNERYVGSMRFSKPNTLTYLMRVLCLSVQKWSLGT